VSRDTPASRRKAREDGRSEKPSIDELATPVVATKVQCGFTMPQRIRKTYRSKAERRHVNRRVLVDHRREWMDFLERLIGGISAMTRWPAEAQLFAFKR
jgi:hypothetical protein